MNNRKGKHILVYDLEASRRRPSIRPGHIHIGACLAGEDRLDWENRGRRWQYDRDGKRLFEPYGHQRGERPRRIPDRNVIQVIPCGLTVVAAKSCFRTRIDGLVAGCSESTDGAVRLKEVLKKGGGAIPFRPLPASLPLTTATPLSPVLSRTQSVRQRDTDLSNGRRQVSTRCGRR